MLNSFNINQGLILTIVDNFYKFAKIYSCDDSRITFIRFSGSQL